MKFFDDLKKGQKSFGEDISRIVNLILLTMVYFIGVGFTSLIAKLFGKHFLELKTNKNLESYWSDLNLTKKPVAEYYRQF